MTEVFFYILEEESEQALERFACRLAEKAHAEGRRIYVHAGSDEQIEAMDKLLWTFRQSSFVPHCTAATLADDDQLTPVVVGTGAPPPGFDDLLVNIGGDTAGFFSRFRRHNEIIAPAAVAEARNLYRFYKDRGYALTTHKIPAG